MKKIMFNDRYGLTKAVIESRKTMTRRLADPKSKYEELRLWQPCIEMEFGLYGYTENDGWEYIEPYYFVGEVVAVAQSYRDVCASGFEPNAAILRLFEDQRLASWSNKMFVKAELMPHQIRITGIKCERLQDISDAGCMKEGVVGGIIGYYVPGIKCKDWSKESYVDTEDGRTWKLFPTPREAFASLIDKVSGRGTWKRNPWVVAYEFELVK
jgi:hypothetical protein